jgi:hypothetical protein
MGRRLARLGVGRSRDREAQRFQFCDEFASAHCEAIDLNAEIVGRVNGGCPSSFLSRRRCRRVLGSQALAGAVWSRGG